MRNLFFILSLLCIGCSSDCVYKNDSYCLTRNRVFQPGAKAHIISDYEIESSYMSPVQRAELYTWGVDASPLMRRWRLESDISAYPRLSGGIRVERAMYNLSLDELNRCIDVDSTFVGNSSRHESRTRDVAYSTVLALAYLQPEVAKKSLMRRIDKFGCVVQDAHPGSKWPVTTDRMIWAVAAYEVYKVTGDSKWFEMIYPVIRNSVDADLQVALDSHTRLLHGGFSFSERPEEVYPGWMQPADIFKSQSLGTCVLYFRTLEVLEEMAVLKGDVALAERCTGTAAWLREAINTYFWQEEKGYYGQYLYGRDAPLLSQRNETLAQALCILWDAADSRHAALAARNVPSVDFGTPCFFPNIAGAPSYYNDAVWPFVQAYWMLASAKAANEEGVLHSIGSIYRSALLFLANYENMNCYNGDWFTTETNSPRMPGSLAGNLSVVYRLLFGIRFDADGMHFSPFVPWTMKASRRLENFRYRDAVLDIRMKGFGDRITSFRVDGKEHQPFIPATLTGRHTIEIRLASESAADSGINLVKSVYMPSTPVVKLDSTQLIWQRDERCHYFVLRDGKIIAQTDSGSFALPEPRYGAWQVIAATNEDNRSFASEPITLYSSSEHYQVEDFCASATYPYSGYEGRGFAEISQKENPRIVIPIRIEQAGEYVLQWRYASSNPVTRINDSPLRAMTVGDAGSYYVVFPLRNNNSGNDWGYSNGITVCFEPGAHTIVLEYPSDAKGMCLMPDQVMLDCLILSKKS